AGGCQFLGGYLRAQWIANAEKNAEAARPELARDLEADAAVGTGDERDGRGVVSGLHEENAGQPTPFRSESARILHRDIAELATESLRGMQWPVGIPELGAREQHEIGPFVADDGIGQFGIIDQ